MVAGARRSGLLSRSPLGGAARALPVVWALLGAGCLAPIQARPADVALPGELRWDTHLSLFTVTPGDASGVARSRERGEELQVIVEGPSTGLDELVGTGIFPLWWAFSGAFGLFRPCETSLELGMLRIGGELRCGLLQQRWGHPLSLAVAAAAATLPGWERRGLWWRTGVDLSRWFRHVALLLNFYFTSGPEAYLVGSPPGEVWDRPLDTTVSHDPGARLYLVRDELRLALALGVGFRLAPDRPAVTIGLTSHVTLGEPGIIAVDCRSCSTFELSGYEGRFGFELTFGVTAPPRRRRLRRTTW